VPRAGTTYKGTREPDAPTRGVTVDLFAILAVLCFLVAAIVGWLRRELTLALVAAGLVFLAALQLGVRVTAG